MGESSNRVFFLGWLLAVTACADAAPNGGPQPGPQPPSYDGKNRALSFDGLNDYVTTGTAAFPIAYGPQTLMMWVRPLRVVIGAGDAGASSGDQQSLVVLRKDFESGVTLGMRRGSYEVWSVYSGRVYARASTPAEPGVWQHVTYSFDGSVHRLYVNGRLQGSSTTEPNNRTPTTAWLGSLDGSNALFVGEMDDVRFYAASLDDAAVAAVTGAPRGASLADSPSLVAWFGFDEVSGPRVVDRSGHGNDALLGDGIPERMPARVLEEP